MDKEDIKKKMQAFIEEVDKKPDILDKVKAKKKTIEPEAKHAEYFEGILQMRGINQEILDYVQKRITNAKAQVPTSVMHGSQFNIDYSVSDRRLIHKIGVELRAKFGGHLKESAQLFSRNHMTSKNVYRLNVFYKAHEVVKGQYVTIEGMDVPLRVTGFLGSKLVTRNMITGKKISVEEDEIERQLKRFKSTILQVKPEVRVMDENFQPVVLNHPEEAEFVKGHDVKIVECRGKYFLAKDV